MSDSRTRLDFGGRVIVWRRGEKSLRIPARTILVRSILLTLALVLAIVGVTTGTYVLSLGEFG
jgi:ABC-type enterobactin transport system permease subunit